MIYKDRLTPPNNWPPLVRYPNYYSDRRLSLLWFLAFAAISLLISVIALIIVFAVEHSWFRDNFNGSLTQYGLWRVCFTTNNTCASWFMGSGTYANLVEQRLNQSKAGINAWQALDIIFLFLITATLIITVCSLICYRMRNNFHYYLAILAVFCAWPAACIGIAALFVFGFAVYNVAAQPRELDWCFYLNLVAVIFAVIAAILLSIYDSLLRKPLKTVDDEAVIETFADLNGYPATLSPSTFVIVRRNKNKRNKPYDYSQTLYPNRYFPTPSTTTTTTDRIIRNDQTLNHNHQMLSPYTSIITTHETNTNIQPTPSTSYRNFEYNPPNIVVSPSTTTIAQQSSVPVSTQSYRRPLTGYAYQSSASPSDFNRLGTRITDQSLNYTTEFGNDYTQRYFQNPIRSNNIDRTFEQKQEPRVLHYYTGYDYFATLDPSETVATRHHPSTSGPGLAIRYGVNPSYQHQNDYIKSTM
ncbi:unnamed protein product [Adineta steineri]|uniref:Uncharacterized protein n=1 Tax=Adineta steineri TaxID=433720 RepID=A0A814CQK0_9BILA|nr:unnamed protein product [Adineta steineri]CAF3612530.1 unnamed protein product [Adineta steineri]